MPAWLADRGLSPAQVGFALSLGTVSRALFPPLWGWLADRIRARRPIFVLSTLSAGGVMLLLALPVAPGAILSLLFLFGFLLVPASPILETLTLARLAHRRDHYGRVRLWG